MNAPSTYTFADHLTAPTPGWAQEADAVVVGSGVAGLSVALQLRSRLEHVVLVTKTQLSSGSTIWAQGGIAAALDATDSPQAHYEDTMVAGAGICDPEAVRTLVTEGPHRVRELISMGARFDRDADGEISLTREGGHHHNRIAHASGDATGREISRALVFALNSVREDPGITVVENAMVIDLLTSQRTDDDPRGRIAGLNLHVIGEGARDGVGAVHAPVVVMATGGIGQVYSSSTNPVEATGDGAAAALRAGAVLSDVEFVQFHPTVLWLGTTAKGQQPLISEAVRGEGAHLLDATGHRFMVDQHELAELAPRDVVAKAMVKQMAATGADHVWLDARHLGKDFLMKRFPGIYKRLKGLGFDMAEDLLPVRPAQHFHSGGIKTNLHGESSLPGLYAVGETACTGVHGANRLASNSLLEGLVFGYRAARHIVAESVAGRLTARPPVLRRGPGDLVSGATRAAIQVAATQGPGVAREAAGMADAVTTITRILTESEAPDVPQVAEWETTNLAQVAVVLAQVALQREETRGGHDRSDFPHESDAWLGSQDVWLDDEGHLCSTFIPLTPQDAAASTDR